MSKEGDKFLTKTLQKVLTNYILRDIIFKHPRKGDIERRLYAGVAELADARDLKSRGTQIPYRFEPGFRHHIYRGVEQPGSSLGS